MSIEEVAAGFAGLSEGASARFEEMARAVAAFQRRANPVYDRYCKSIERTQPAPQPPPFSFPTLPVETFKHAAVACFDPAEAEHVFESSGTGTGSRSRHYVRDLSVYERAVCTAFEHEFGAGPFVLVAHLPHYAGRGRTSSLLYMVELLIRRYGGEGSGFFLEEVETLHHAARLSRSTGRPLMLFGAAFGLLDLAESDAFGLPPDALVVETGGMKTFRREMGRTELHARLAGGFGLARERIRSEYGMCELMSQCYTRGGEIFHMPPWVRFQVVDTEYPFRILEEGRPGALALFDLANLYSVSAVLTEDRAVRRGSGFEVLGRLSRAELRGCNFLLEHV